MQPLGREIVDPVSSAKAGLRRLYRENVAALTPEANRRFQERGIYDGLDNLLEEAVVRFEGKNSPFRRQVRRVAAHARSIAFSTAGGAVVGTIGAAVTGSDIATGAEQGAVYGVILGTASEAIKYAAAHTLKAKGKLLWERVKNASEAQGETAAANIEHLVRTYAAGNAEIAAKSAIVAAIEKYRSEKSVVGTAVVAPFTGAVKGGFVGFTFNLLSPYNLDLGMAASIGAVGNTLNKTYSAAVEKRAMERTRKKLSPLVGDLSDKERKQLVGGLMYRWCP